MTTVELGELGNVLDVIKSKLSKKYKENLFEAVQKTGHETALDIADNAQSEYDNAEYDGKVSDARIECYVDNETFNKLENSCEYEIDVVAEGKAVKFIEFGTSTNDTGTHDWQEDYNYHKGGMGKNYWWFSTKEPVQLTGTGELALTPKRKDGTRKGYKTNSYFTRGNKPNRCLYNSIEKNKKFVVSHFKWNMKKR